MPGVFASAGEKPDINSLCAPDEEVFVFLCFGLGHETFSEGNCL